MKDPYASRYPGQGKVAVLCEGDIAGFESDLLARVTSELGYVDIWPCGTKSAIYGVADSLGRAVTILCIEDRDYRSLQDAEKDCEDAAQNRRLRGVRLQKWHVWRRNEIENYFLEVGILCPVLSEAFDVPEQDVLDRLQRLLVSLAVDQAAAWTLYSARRLASMDATVIGGLPKKTARPTWRSGLRAFVAPEPTIVRDSLLNCISNGLKAADKRLKKADPNALIEAFDSKCKGWGDPKVADAQWRCEWSGKDIIIALDRWLAAEFGWVKDNGAVRVPIDWENLTPGEAEAMDREMLGTLQGRLVRQFWELWDDGLDREIRTEWMQVVSDTRDALSQAHKQGPAGKP